MYSYSQKPMSVKGLISDTGVSSLSHACVYAFISTCVEIQTASAYKAANAFEPPTCKRMYLGLSSINVLYVFDSVESQGSRVAQILVMNSAPYMQI